MELADLQIREVFHLTFLRVIVPSPVGRHIVLKGGANLRFFYASVRYSEDMDLDVGDIPAEKVRDRVMGILRSPTFLDTLRTFGIVRVVPPDMRVAKQTATVQRFKVHLLTTANIDLFTKIEFSRRGLDRPVRVEGVAAPILAAYRMPPLVLPHYGPEAAIRQKLQALLDRAAIQARDVFDLYWLNSQPEANSEDVWRVPRSSGKRIHEAVLAMDYSQFEDTVVGYFGQDDRDHYGRREMWDEIRLTVVARIEAAEKS